MGKGKKKAFSRIKDQVGRRIAGWKGNLLSNAGCEILIKAVAQATTTYTMSCFKLPDSLCHELNSMVCQFWWGQKEGAKDGVDFMGKTMLTQIGRGNGI